jgi:xylulokinase
VHDTPLADARVTMTHEPVAVGIDLGTSSLKAVAVRADGSVAASATVAYPTARPGPGAAEQDAADWWSALRTAVASLAAMVPPAAWVGVGLSAMIPTLVAADADMGPLGPAITWEDGRAEAQGERLRVGLGGDALYARTGQWVDGRYLLPVAMRLRELDDPRGGAAWLLGAKDWLFARLTGEVATDPSTATGVGAYDLGTGAWDETVVEAALGRAMGATVGMGGIAGIGIADPGGWQLLGRPALPAVRPSTHVAALTVAAAADLGLPGGLPVVLGAADSVLAARGLGVTQPGAVAYVAGTSTVIMGVAPGHPVDPHHRYLVTPLEHPGTVGLEMDLVATGSAVRWLATLLGIPAGDEAELWRLAGDHRPGADGLLFLPYLGPGEQGALWDPALRGALVGATLAHGRGQIARALLDGIVLESRRCSEVLRGLSGDGDIVMTGPSARSAVVLRALADATGRRVRWPLDPAHPASAWGAAALAVEATGSVAPPRPALADGVLPDPRAAAAWSACWERHEAARIALSPLTRGAPTTPGGDR